MDGSKFYINGAWVDPIESRMIDVINPADESVIGQVALGGQKDVDAAVSAARAAFPAWSATSREDRLEILERVLAEFKARHDEFGKIISQEMGAPAGFARQFHAGLGITHLKVAAKTLADYHFEEVRGTTQIVQIPIGVCGLITPWNYPINQIAAKVAPALATGCTMVLKPSEVSPYSAILWTQVLEAAGVPPGVFNLVNGDAVTGRALSEHPDVDMISITGSTTAGIDVAQRAAPTVKRVGQELGGKSANILLDGPGFEAAVATGVKRLMTNSGQTCSAPSRMLVPNSRMADAARIASEVAATLSVGDPMGNPDLGPVATEAQWNKVQEYIQSGIDEGARLSAGGLGRPDGLAKGYFVKPTIFAQVRNDMRVAREEIFGPVLCIIGFDDLDDAIRIANDSLYGIAAYISGDAAEDVRKVAAGLRVAQVALNGTPSDPTAPFGGFRRSGNGREWGAYGFHEYLEYKTVLGDPALKKAEPA